MPIDANKETSAIKPQNNEDIKEVTKPLKENDGIVKNENIFDRKYEHLRDKLNEQTKKLYDNTKKKKENKTIFLIEDKDWNNVPSIVYQSIKIIIHSLDNQINNQHMTN